MALIALFIKFYSTFSKPFSFKCAMKTFNKDAVVSMFMNVDNVIKNAAPFFFYLIFGFT
jgi:hypothetical protein